MKHVLLYLGDQQHKLQPLQAILEKLQLPYTFLDDTHLQETIGHLLHMEHDPAAKQKNSKHIAQDLLLYHEVDEKTIRRLQQMLAQQQITMERQAMCTVHNIDWKLEELLSEIIREHEIFQQLRELNELLHTCTTLLPQDHTLASWQPYERAFINAYEVCTTQSEPAQISGAYTELKAALQNLQKRS